MDLENTFYIFSIVYMSIMLLIMIAILVIALVIRAKINRIHRMVDDKVNSLRGFTDKVAVLLRTMQYFIRR